MLINKNLGEKMKISYSVVLYNNSLTLIERLVNNIIETTPKEWEYSIYLINNSVNNENINLYLQKLVSKNKNIFAIFPVENKGFGAGHNLAIKRIKSEYHVIVNPDVKIPDGNQVKKMVSFMTNNEILLLAPLIKFPNGNTQKLVKREPTIFDMAIRFIGGPLFKKRKEWFVFLPDGYSKIHKANNLPGSFLVFNSATLKKIHGFDERYFLYMEDSDISKSVSQIGNTVFYPEAFVYHEWQRQNKKSLKGMFQMISSTLKYFNKWGWKFY